MKSLIKTAILFVVTSLVLSFFGSYLTLAFGSMSAVLSFVSSSGGVGLVLSSVFSFLTWLFDLIFMSNSVAYTNQLMDASIKIGSVAWGLSFFRVLFGCTLIVFIISLIFGGKHV